MKRNEFNTNQFSLERIYKYDIFLTYYFDHNNPENNIIGILKFLSNAALEAINEKYEDWNIKPSYDEGDHDTCSSVELSAAGYRLETDKEYHDRIASNLTRKKVAYDNWQRMKVLYESGAYSQDVAEMEAIINKLK